MWCPFLVVGTECGGGQTLRLWRLPPVATGGSAWSRRELCVSGCKARGLSATSSGLGDFLRLQPEGLYGVGGNCASAGVDEQSAGQNLRLGPLPPVATGGSAWSRRKCASAGVDEQSAGQNLRLWPFPPVATGGSAWSRRECASAGVDEQSAGQNLRLGPLPPVATGGSA